MSPDETKEIKDFIEAANNAVIDQQSNLRDEIIRLIEIQAERINRIEESVDQNTDEMRRHKRGHVPGLGTTIAIIGLLMTFVAPIIGAAATMLLQKLMGG